MEGGDVSNNFINFQQQIFDLKEDFYRESMNAPSSLEQELLLMEIVREDLYDVADAFDKYISGNPLEVPSNNTIYVYNAHSKKITEDVAKYSKQKQVLMSEFMDALRDVVDSAEHIDGDCKRYYINQIFRIYVFNMDPLPGCYCEEGI